MFENAAKAQAVYSVIGGEHSTGIKIIHAPDPEDIVRPQPCYYLLIMAH